LRTEVGKVSRVAIIGLGYVGLTTALGLAKIGHDVIGVETNEARLQTLKTGVLPMFEPGLDRELVESLRAGQLTLTGNLGDAMEKADLFFICVSTPQSVSGEADLTFVQEVYEDLVGAIKPESIVILKSTVPVGTGEELTRTMTRKDVFYASNPEFLREGTALKDFMKPDRILVGSDDSGVAAKVMSLYEVIDAPKIVTSVKSAELIKYAANAYLASRLSFVNDIAALCEQVGANIDDVVLGMGSDPRIGSSFLSPGPGWGGSCFPKDTRALVAVARANQVKLQIVESAIKANDDAFDRVVSRLATLLGGDLSGKSIAVLGLAFKANTDDTRDSPALEVINRLLTAGSTVQAFDPIALSPADSGFKQSSTVIEAVTQADALLVMTEWNEFKEIDPQAVSDAMKGSIVLDTRRVLPPESWKSAFKSFYVLGVGDN
jgi:UDPglucose 6-dehydrogenase